jgi:hypothetical protein
MRAASLAVGLLAALTFSIAACNHDFPCDACWQPTLPPDAGYVDSASDDSSIDVNFVSDVAAVDAADGDVEDATGVASDAEAGDAPTE